MASTDSESQNQHKDMEKPSSIKEKAEEDVALSPDPELSPPPEGGLEAWLVAAGGASIFFSCLGFTNSFGTFQEYYMTHQLRDQSPDDIAWIGSLAVFIQFAAGAIGGPMFDRYGGWVIRPAAISYVFGVMMVSLCKEYWQFMLAQGILLGSCMAFMQLPAMAAISHFFDKKRAAALGIVVSGSSVGGVVMPITLSKLLNDSDVGFGWSVRITGFIMVPFMIFAAFTVKSRLPPRKTTFFDPSIFRNKLFMSFIAAMFFMFLGMFTPLFYIPTYAVSRGMDRVLASYMLAVVNAASTFGRIIPGVLADKYGKLNMFAVAGVSTGIVVFCMNSAETTAAIVVYSIVFGFTSGMIISSGSAAVSVCTDDVQKMGTYMGTGMALASVAVLVGPPLNGALVDQYHSFSQVSMFSGAVCLFGGLVAVALKTLTSDGVVAWT